MLEIDAKRLTAMERWTLILASVVIGASFIALARPMAFGVSLGALLMVGNAWALRRIGLKAARAASRPALGILLFNLKMALLLGLVYLVVRYLPIDPIGFLIGISIFPAAVLIAAVQSSFDNGNQPDGETPGGIDGPSESPSGDV